MKSILLFLPLLFNSLLSFSSEKDPAGKEIIVSSYSKLVINAEVRVVLTNEPYANSIRLQGEPEAVNNIAIKQTKDRISITVVNKKIPVRNVYIFVPVRSLLSVIVNDKAFLTSAATLQKEQLYIQLNDACRLSIASNGDLLLSESPFYEFDYRVLGAKGHYKRFADPAYLP